jgi:hypothetical protein
MLPFLKISLSYTLAAISVMAAFLAGGFEV